MRRALAVLLLALPAAVRADEIWLTGGGRVSGVLVQRTDALVVIDVGPGRLALPAHRVLRVDAGPTALAEHRARAQRLAPSDVAGWLELGRWARDHELLTQATEAFEHVLAIEADNPVAHLALGHVQVDGRFVTFEEGQRARGLVLFEGSWVTPDEQAAGLRARSEAAAAERARAESQARIRQAEAEARAAELAARRAAERSVPDLLAPPAGFWPWGCSPRLRVPPRYTNPSPTTPPPPPPRPRHQPQTDTGHRLH